MFKNKICYEFSRTEDMSAQIRKTNKNPTINYFTVSFQNMKEEEGREERQENIFKKTNKIEKTYYQLRINS